MLSNIRSVYDLGATPDERGEIASNILMIAIMVLVTVIAFGLISSKLRTRAEKTANCIEKAGTTAAGVEACKQANGSN